MAIISGLPAPIKFFLLHFLYSTNVQLKYNRESLDNRLEDTQVPHADTSVNLVKYYGQTNVNFCSQRSGEKLVNEIIQQQKGVFGSLS